MTSTKNRARRLVAAGAFAVAAVAAPFAASVLSTSAGSEDLAGPACLAWFGNKEDGNCLSYSNGYRRKRRYAVLPDSAIPTTATVSASHRAAMPGTTIDKPLGLARLAFLRGLRSDHCGTGVDLCQRDHRRIR